MELRIDISQETWVKGFLNLESLNRTLFAKSDLMAHQVATMTGCNLDQARAFLQYLDRLWLVRPIELVYHKEHGHVPITAYPLGERNLHVIDGFLYCDECDANIDDRELKFDTLYKIIGTVQIVNFL